ncbi:Plasmodium exported protein, unknown function [Plasmodium ovale wallikeri]|uniref:Uncharacterized protein n=2 Tax=Plasmodium ovale TaxID=36330 RepID=A0A1A9AIF1_PLAOA|nr:Plasmodium exported protein, unknown function [Plasmodium ovale wallikeri]SBT58649.1 Plasmodium exported protein, unknown function [Plasmodium ovale wallikeri]SBT76551.1 hypothetical protein, conserved [Plasmodium ovale]
MVVINQNADAIPIFTESVVAPNYPMLPDSFSSQHVMKYKLLTPFLLLYFTILHMIKIVLRLWRALFDNVGMIQDKKHNLPLQWNILERDNKGMYQNMYTHRGHIYITDEYNKLNENEKNIDQESIEKDKANNLNKIHEQGHGTQIPPGNNNRKNVTTNNKTLYRSVAELREQLSANSDDDSSDDEEYDLDSESEDEDDDDYDFYGRNIFTSSGNGNKQKVRKQVKREVRKELKKELIGNLKKELKDEVRKELINEFMDELKKGKTEIIREKENSHETDGERHKYDYWQAKYNYDKQKQEEMLKVQEMHKFVNERLEKKAQWTNPMETKTWEGYVR